MTVSTLDTGVSEHHSLNIFNTQQIRINALTYWSGITVAQVAHR
ncbi:MAG TPA: hypothetical protein VFS76_25435 [Pyrinomonadaceae bacterium]|nr:hypothetical protein [Pyrinomonadaceae bacterium]